MASPPGPKRPPSRHGVSPSRVLVPKGPWPTLLSFLVERFPAIGADEWTLRIRQGLVLSADGSAFAVDAPCPQGQVVHYYRQTNLETGLPQPAQVLFEDAYLLVADKPHFMPVTPGGRYLHTSLLVQLKQRTGCDDLSPLHRIDRETAGVVVFSKRAQDRDAYQSLFRQHQVAKYYEAVAPFLPTLTLPRVHQSRLQEDLQFFRSREVPGEPNSETRLSLLDRHGGLALYGLTPTSGKRHQLRIHLNALGIPIVGDQFYPAVLRGPAEPEDFSHPLQLLAKQMAFTDPVTGQARVFESHLRLNWPPRLA